MRLTHRWTPPRGTSPNKILWGDELVFPVVFGRHSRVSTTDMEISHFGIWLVNIHTGQDRFIEAPFYQDRVFRDPVSWVKQWRILGLHDGAVLLCLSENQSYDIGYYIFLYDGQVWTQVIREKERWRTLTIGREHDTRVWHQPGPLPRWNPALMGGHLLRLDRPTRLVVDFSHTFAHDSGPDESVRSPEFLDAIRELRQKSDPTPTFTDCSRQQIHTAKGLLPPEFEERFDPQNWDRAMSRCDKDIWLTSYIRSSEGFIQLFRFTEAV